MKTLAGAYGEGVASLEYRDLPSSAIETAKIGFIDCSAVIAAGCREDPVRILRDTLAIEEGADESTLYFSSQRMTAPAAAWINGTAGHVLDYDDFARGHPSVVMVPALLAEGEVLDARGIDQITTYVAGYEVFIDLQTCDAVSYQTKGWHPTPLMGALAAAAACAKLRRLDAGAIASALGIAAAQAGGITASYGTMAKSVQVGKAAHTGILSARLAARGMTAGNDVLDHEHGDFCSRPYRAHATARRRRLHDLSGWRDARTNHAAAHTSRRTPGTCRQRQSDDESLGRAFGVSWLQIA